MKHLINILLLLLISVSAWATHNRAGEITYRHLGGLTYEAVITTCTKTSVIADREFLELTWGDGILDTLDRESITPVPGMDAQINIYRGTHTYTGPGQYLLQMIDPNRNEGVQNIPGSINQQFAIQSLLVIHPIAGHNNSVQLLNPAKESACLFRVWQHNPSAFDPDGDLLRFSLITNLGVDSDLNGLADPIAGYTMPDVFSLDPSDIFSVDESTGTVTWDVPLIAGEYNIAILIEEFRIINGIEFKMGHVIRDMQILVETCPNDPPIIEPIPDTCIVAFTNLQFTVNGSDPNGDPIELSATGGPLSQVENPAFFSPGSTSGLFSWTPECTEVRLAPYQVVFKAVDFSSTVDLTTFMTMNITVIAPPVENPAATAIGNSIELVWDVHPCFGNVSAAVSAESQYKIYRRQGSYGFEPAFCETGVPAYTGYELIGTVTGLTNTNYTDNDGVFYGDEFCYMVVMCLPDGAESIASEEFCAAVPKVTPVITNVSVNSTDAAAGEIYIAWSPASELDTEIFPGPYRYELLHGENGEAASEVVFESLPSNDLFNEDTTFVHSGLNTLDFQHQYRVNLWSGDDFIGSSALATSIYLTLESDDQEITLFMNYATPWVNAAYDIFRKAPGESEFGFLVTTTEPVYTDTGLENNDPYCYYVTSTGSYPLGGTIDPIINDSQEACGIAVDLTPPCAPELALEFDCALAQVYLEWTNPNNSCDGTPDTEQYQLWWTPVEGQPLQPFAIIETAEDTTFVFNSDNEIGSIAGCYAITALDSLTPDQNGTIRRNESAFSNILCVDNCPIYELPNIFTPNNDGINDRFIPIQWQYIDSVDFKVFSRWGTLVFDTGDPEIKWDGTHRDTGEISTDGTYFYVAKVYTIRLSGIVVEDRKGNITITGGSNPFRE